MPYADAGFDVVTSTFGVMFTPDQRAVAGELARVARAGARLVLATWTPEGGVGDLFRLCAPFQPAPPPGAGNPMDWGREEHVRSLLGDAFELEFERVDSPGRYASGEEYWDLFVTAFGPVHTIAASLDDGRREELHRTWVEWADSMREGDHVVHHREYLLVLGTRR
jgi:SAM-dependent methyltransferase